jgi:hypothetical protein
MEDGVGDGAVVGDSETEEVHVIVTVALHVEVEKQPIFKVIVGRGPCMRRWSCRPPCRRSRRQMPAACRSYPPVGCRYRRNILLRKQRTSARCLRSPSVQFCTVCGAIHRRGWISWAICVQVGNTSTGEAPRSL